MELQLQLRRQQGEFLLDLDMAASGERLGIFGPSGSGKSTLVSLIAGLSRPDRGRIMLDDMTLFDSYRGISIATEERRIALVFQQHALFPHLNIRSNLLYGYQRCPAAERRIELDEVMEVMGITPLLEQYPATLSGGESQRVALGRAILASPRLLIMDEPLSALDDDLRYRIIPYLKLVSERFGIPFVFISHSLVEMRLMAEQVAVLEKGALTSLITPEELARKRMGSSRVGYINLIPLGKPSERNGLLAFPWGGRELLLSAATGAEAGIFEL
jgi:molybdate transport system ATP-binding protein